MIKITDGDDDDDVYDVATVRGVFKAILGLPFTTKPNHPLFTNIDVDSLDVLVDMEVTQPGSTR